MHDIYAINKHERKLSRFIIIVIYSDANLQYITYKSEHPIKGEMPMLYLKYVIPFLNLNLIIHILNVGFNTNIQQDNIWIILLVISWNIIIDFIKDKIK